MHPPERLDTSRLVLRRPKLSDAAAMLAFGKDPEVVRFLEWPAHTRIEDAQAATAAALTRWERGEEFTWRITVRPSDEPVGSISCRVRGHMAEIGFVLARERWGSGFATEAASTLMEWLRSQDGIERIWALCDVENPASARVLEKVGMSREGVLRRWAPRPNLPGAPVRDCFAYSWVRDDAAR